jgi:diguanylate cyclase (GGDEF)-like protein
VAQNDFPFTDPFGDARVEELKLLSWTAQHGKLTFPSVPIGPWHDLLVALVIGEIVTVFPYAWAKEIYLKQGIDDMAHQFGMPADTPLSRSMAQARHRAICDLYEMRPPDGLRLTHLGRVRLSELKQALRTGREREPFGILWDGRHWEQDTQIAILEAGEGTPLALAYLDMNGLKQINDNMGHDEGDKALKAYFHAVASVLGDKGQAYRLSGGADEVFAVIPKCDEQTAVTIVQGACAKLMNERLWSREPNALLSIAAGVITTTDPTASPTKLRSTADEHQKRAKEKSRTKVPRPSVIAFKGSDDPSFSIIKPS